MKRIIMIICIILLSGCDIEGAIDDLAWKLTDTSETDLMIAKWDASMECDESCGLDYETELDISKCQLMCTRLLK